MSGGSSKPDPYHQKDPPKRSKANDDELLPKSYRGAVKPKRIDILPNGQKRFVYDCKHCGKEKSFEKRKTAKNAFCDRNCSHEWQKYGRPPPKLSPEGAKRIGQRAKELWANPEHRAKRLRAIEKAKQTPEAKEKHRKAVKEATSKPGWKEKQSKARKGKKRPPEVGRNISAAKMGHPVSDETRKKLSEANKGENNPSYKDGRSSERQRFYRSKEWGEQRERVLKRDNHTCQGCGWTEDEVKRLQCHHIDPLADTEHEWDKYPDDLVVPLCEVCHPPTESQDGKMKKPLNGRGSDTKPERLNNPKYNN